MFVLSVHESGKLSIEQCSTEIHLRIGKVIITESQMTKKKKKSFFLQKISVNRSSGSLLEWSNCLFTSSFVPS